MDAIIAINSSQRIILFNPAAEAMFGLAAQMVLGRPMGILMPTRFRGLHADHVKQFVAHGITARKMGALGELSGLRANGEEFPIEATISAIASKGGGIYVAIVRDITARIRMERQLRSFIDYAPAAIAMFDRDMRYLAASRLWRDYYGLHGDIAGRSHCDELLDRREPWREALPRALAGEAVASAGDTIERPGVPRVWLEWEIRPWYSSNGEIEGVILLTEDITERKRQDEQIRLLLGEVNHRSKNMLALVQAIARQTTAFSPEDFLERFGERVRALAASQDLLVRSDWKGVDLETLIQSQVAHFSDLVGTRISVKGPALTISARAAQAIGMAMHELTTNAGKYGALANGDGRVDIVWHVSQEEGGEVFVISWAEQNGPPVSPPSRCGFGSTVISRLAEASLDAKVDLDYASFGLIWRLECPAEQVIGL